MGFPVKPKNKNRRCDDFLMNEVNSAAARSDTMVTLFADRNVANTKRPRKLGRSRGLRGWILGEEVAERQMGILPDHRTFFGRGHETPQERELSLGF